jgi:hypothetical protein
MNTVGRAVNVSSAAVTQVSKKILWYRPAPALGKVAAPQWKRNCRRSCLWTPVCVFFVQTADGIPRNLPHKNALPQMECNKRFMFLRPVIIDF